MTTPAPVVVGAIYAHPGLFFAPVLFRVISANDNHVIVRPVLGSRRPLMEITVHHFASGCFTLVDKGSHPDEPIPYRVAGEQPAVEFSAGPQGPGPLWTDERLAAEFFGGESA